MHRCPGTYLTRAHTQRNEHVRGDSWNLNPWTRGELDVNCSSAKKPEQKVSCRESDCTSFWRYGDTTTEKSENPRELKISIALSLLNQRCLFHKVIKEALWYFLQLHCSFFLADTCLLTISTFGKWQEVPLIEKKQRNWTFFNNPFWNWFTVCARDILVYYTKKMLLVLNSKALNLSRKQNDCYTQTHHNCDILDKLQRHWNSFYKHSLTITVCICIIMFVWVTEDGKRCFIFILNELL